MTSCFLCLCFFFIRQKLPAPLAVFLAEFFRDAAIFRFIGVDLCAGILVGFTEKKGQAGQDFIPLFIAVIIDLIAKLLGSIKSPLYGLAYALQAVVDKDGEAAPAEEVAAEA